ncbi:MAG: c-type cytochrome [Chthoniobacter sp.]|nr:c-type cytochrome [Chthoniobacter sp.]
MKSILLLFTLVAAAVAAPFEIRDGDRVVLLGDTLLEREGTYGNLETHLQAAFPAAHFTVRNLAYSADNPLGWSRASFDPAAKGLERLKEQIATVNPTVCILGYGMASSLEALAGNDDPTRYGPITSGEAGVAEFKKQLGALMDSIQQITAKATPDAKVRFILLSPIRHEDLRAARPGLPDPAPHNALLEKFTAAIGELATERGGTFVNVFKPGAEAAGARRTDNGIHLHAAGHSAWAALVADQLGWAQKEKKDAPALRAAILKKNDLFFHRWRPANHTYIFGFRKGEQGRNAVEIPKFDPLIADAEVEIDRLKKNPGTPAKVVEAPKAEPAPEVAKLPVPNFTVEDGMELTLWAETPLLAKPVGMNWDSAGRLWVACSPVYPMITPGGHPADKVVILEDTDHDGKADKSTTFATDLLIAASVAPVLEKAPSAKSERPLPQTAYVAASTDLFELTDSDRDNKAESRRPILSGFGTEDTHHTLHTLRWGPDGRLYMNQSIYIHSHIETPWGVVRLNSGGVLAWDPRTEKVEVMFRGCCNPWGHQFDANGQSFLTDGAGGEGIVWAIPGAMYFTYENGKKILQSVSPGGYPKFASLELIRSPLFPADWQGHAITCDFRAHRVVRFAINDLSEGANPKSGYVTKAMPDLIRTSDSAFRPIDVKHGPDGALYIADWSNPIINHGEVDFRDPRRDHVNGRIWRLAPKGKPALAWGSFPPGSTTAMPKGRSPAEAVTLIKDASPRVRLEAMRALSKNPTAANAALVLEAAVKAPEGDPFYSYAAWLSINDVGEAWVAALASGAWKPDTEERQRQLAWGLANIPADRVSKSLAAAIGQNGIPRDGSGPWIELIGQAGTARELDLLWTAVTEKKLVAPAIVRALDALASAARNRKERPANRTEAVVDLFAVAPVPAIRLAGVWKLAPAVAALVPLTGNAETSESAFEALRDIGNLPAQDALKKLVAEPNAPAIRGRAAAALASLDFNATALLAAVNAQPNEDAALGIWRGILNVKDAGDRLAAALPADLAKHVAAAGIRAARERGRGGDKLVAALTPLTGGATVTRDVKADIAALLASTPTKGQPASGEAIYHRIGCVACHSIGGAGGKFGPDFTSIGASAPLDYLVESVLDPAAKVKEGYIAFIFTMKDGTQTVGIPTRETATEQFIRPGPGVEIPIAKANIAKRESAGSLMPPGLIDALKEQEKQDLLAFLTQLGRPGPYDTTKSGIARTWAVFSGSDLAKITPPGFKALTYTDGRLAKETLTALLPKDSSILAQTTFTNDAAVKTRFTLIGITRAYLDGSALAIASNPNPEITLTPGRHTLTVQLDSASLPPAIGVTCADVNFVNE